MKKIIFATIFTLGLILTISENETTYAPNLIGLTMLACTAPKLKPFSHD